VCSSDLAEEGEETKGSRFHQAIQAIRKNSSKLLHLIDEIMDLARLESNSIKLHEESVDAVAFTQSVFDAYRLEAQRKSIQFRLHTSLEEGFRFLIDPNRLEKILNNLLSNALKFTPPGESIRINLYKEADQAVFEVADTGRGIPEADLPHVFERYFQSKDEKLIQSGGSGIGLSLCQELAKLMNGQLTVKSKYGEGSTFRLAVPARQSTEQSNRAQKNDLGFLPEAMPAATNGTSRNMSKIMVVEDNPEVQSFLRLLLEEDYQVSCFNDGQEALEFLQSSVTKELPVDLILSDINMPRMNGYDLIDAVKQHEKWRQLPMIMLTARIQERSKLQALRMGVDDYLTKPFSPTELKVRLRNILDNYQKRLASKQAYLEVNPEFEDTLSADQAWLQELEQHSIAALDQQIELNINYLADQMAIGQRQLARKVKLITGLTIGKYIHEIKLQKARHLLEQKTFPTVAEVGYVCGFKSPSYFSKKFNEHFGKAPTAYV